MRQQREEAQVTEAYVLDCQQVTQSLFYQGGVDLRFFRGGAEA